MAESSDTACPVSPLKLLKSSPVKAVESVNKENTKQLRSILARPTGEKAKEKKRLRWDPDVVDPCTNKEEYMQRKLNAWLAQNELVEQEVSSYEEKENEASDHNNSISVPLEIVEGSSVEAVEIIKNKDSNQPRSIRVRRTGEKAKEKKRLRWAPDVVDPCTNKDEYWRRFLIVEQEVSSSEEKKSERSDKTSITSSITEPLEFGESSSPKDGEIIKKEDSKQLRSILARPTGGKAKEKKKLRWAPDVVDPSTNKDEYWRRFVVVEQEVSSSDEKKNETSDKNIITSSIAERREFVESKPPSDEKKNETSDKNIITSSITERREFVESSSVKDVKILQKKDSNQLRSILARPAAICGKAKEKKKLRWAPDVVDPCTNKDEYWRRFIVPNNLAEEISLEEEKKQ